MADFFDYPLTADEHEAYLHWDYPLNEAVYTTTRRQDFEALLERTEHVKGRVVNRRLGQVRLPLDQALGFAQTVRPRRLPKTQAELDHLARVRARRLTAPDPISQSAQEEGQDDSPAA